MIALISGANKGIGYEVARQLGQAGMTVLVGSRDPDRGTAAVEALLQENIPAVYIPLDVTDVPSVRAAAEMIAKTYGRLDVLVNNAGINVEFPGRVPSEVTLQELRDTFETNVFGLVTLTNALLPMLREAPAGKIINVSSELGLPQLAADVNAPSITAYSLSKAAVNMLTVFYAKELRHTSITVNGVSPGFVKTDINHGAGFRTAAEGAVDVVKVALLDDGTSGAFFLADGGRI